MTALDLDALVDGAGRRGSPTPTSGCHGCTQAMRPDGSRSTRSTCPPTGTTPTSPPLGTSTALQSLTDHAGDPERAGRRLSACRRAVADTVYERVRGKLDAESRSRTCASTSRTATAIGGDDEEDADAVAAARALRRGGRRPARRHRSSGSGSRASRRRPGGAALRTLGLFVDALLDRGRPAAGFRGHAAEGHLGRPGRGDGDDLRAARGGVRPGRSRAALRDPGRDAAGRPRCGRNGAGGPDDPRRRRPVHRPALRHLRLLGVVRHRRRLPEHGAPGRRPRQGGDAGGRRRYRRARVCDGSTNVLPVGDRDAVTAAWRLHARLVRRSLERGFYQGWDLHPAQLPTRYVATYAFFRDGLGAATSRLSDYAQRREAGVLDEPATARALADFVMRGIECGAVDLDEVTERSGIDRDTLAVLARRQPEH